MLESLFAPGVTLTQSCNEFIKKLLDIHPTVKSSLIKKGFRFAWKAHINQKRRSGEPYLIHPVNVAMILAEQKLDYVTITAGLLHDVIEDTDITMTEMIEEFGEDVALLVDGVTKISTLESKSKYHRQVETYRKMLLSMSKDLRVIVIKFADRLHNLRTLKYLPPKKIKEIASESLNIYAPLAHRFGMAKIKWELEDLSFKYLYPNEYSDIVSRIVDKRHARETLIDSINIPLKKMLDEVGIKATVVGRPKHFYSIHKKMTQRQVPFDEIYDLLALRIITDNIGDCYRILGIVHSFCKPIEDKFKDYIANPKSNGYQSLHTGIASTQGQIIEVQIRTWEMNSVAEDGIAAHWLYKEGMRRPITDEDKNLTWLKNLIEWQKDFAEPSEFFEQFKVDLFTNEIFVYTPKGHVHELPCNATVLDFAFSVHTDLGLCCIGGKVDGVIQPVDYELQNGNSVEILHLSSKKPSQDWLAFVQTSKARTAIKHWLNTTQKQECVNLGKKVFVSVINKLSKNFDYQKHTEEILENFNVKSLDLFYYRLGNNTITKQELMTYISKELINNENNSVAQRIIATIKRRNGAQEIKINARDESVMTRRGICCSPLPGDDIIGFMTQGRGISIHRTDCENTLYFNNDEDRLYPVIWDDDKSNANLLSIFLEITGADRPKLLHDITHAIYKNDGEIINGTISTEEGAVLDILEVKIRNAEQMRRIIKRLKKIKSITRVKRLINPPPKRLN